MITFTKEQIIASAHARIEFAEMMLAGELEPLKERTWSIELELARIALVSLEAEKNAEPVAFINGAWTLVYYRPPKELGLKIGDKLYTAPPAPVVQCPFPCGWENLEKHAIQDAAFISRGLVEGEVVTEALRKAAIANNELLLKVIATFRSAPAQGDKE